MQRETLDKILSLHDETKAPIEFHGIPHTYGNPKPITPPKQQALEMESLTGFVDYVLTNRDEVKADDCVIQVVDHTTVSLFGKVDPIFKTRPLYAAANLNRIFKPFEFNRWYEHEEFMIKLYSLFQTDKAGKLKKFIDTVRMAKRVDEQISEDNSVSIKRAQSRGIDIPGDRDAFVAELKPFRTFIEVDQPESKFIFRIKEGRCDELECALFECDGGAWVNAIRDNIKDYLRAELMDDDGTGKIKSLGIPIFA